MKLRDRGKTMAIDQVWRQEVDGISGSRAATTAQTLVLV